jgi:hypothetical protein
VATSQRTPVYSISIKEGVGGLGGERAGSGGDGRGHETAKALGPGQYRVSGSGHRALEVEKGNRKREGWGRGCEEGCPKRDVGRGLWKRGVVGRGAPKRA